MMLRFGLAAWSNKHFDHILYPLRTLHRDWLPRYSKVFPIVEADILHHQAIDDATMQEWVEQTPDGFRFLPKLHKDATHPEQYGPGALAAAQAAHASLETLRSGHRLGPTLAQFPKSFARNDETTDWLDEFLRTGPPEGMAIEFRHPSWFVSETEAALRQAGVALCWGTYESAMAPAWDTAAFRYVRFIGTTYKKRDRWVSQKDRLEAVLDIRARLQDAPEKETFVVVTNRFEGHAIDSLPRIAAALGDTTLAKRCTRPPAQPLFPEGDETPHWGLAP